MTATSAASQTQTYHIDRLVPGIHRIRCIPAAGQESPTWFATDPCLSTWARDLLSDGHTEHGAQGLDLEQVLSESGLTQVPLTAMSVSDDGSVSISFGLSEGELLYGAYDADGAGLDRRGDIVDLVTELHPIGNHAMSPEAGTGNAARPRLEIGEGGGNYGELHLPIVISSTGYAVYVANHRSRAVLDLGASDSDAWTFSATGGPAEVFVIGPGLAPREIAARFGRLLGVQPLPPIWTLGYIQSRFGYESFDHLEGVVSRLREEQLPVHGVVLDVQWLDEHVNLKWNQDGFANAPQRLEKLHSEYGVRVVAITEPGTGGTASNFADGASQGWFALKPDSDDIYPSDQWYCVRGIPGYRKIEPGYGGLVNFFREGAADWWYDQHRHLIEDGIDAWWLDLNEPEDVHEDYRFTSVDWPEERAEISGDDSRSVFALAQQRAFTQRDMLATDRRPFLLSRSGAAGSQRYGTSPWSGDIGATWGDLRRQTHLVLSAGACGIPLWGCDVGGFVGDPGEELFARWMQLATWLPVFRAHGCMTDREPWSQGPAALEMMRASLVLRAQLLPSIATWARQSFRDGMPLARPMWMDFPNDERFAQISDQWMFGEILVAPVIEEGATERTVELPDGEWVDLWSGMRHPGGVRITVPVNGDSNPAFVRAGTAIAVDPTPLAHRAMQWPPSEILVWSFPDDDGRARGTLVVDDGLTRRHERGAYAEISLDVVEGELSAERVSGSFPLPKLRLAHPTPGVV